MRERVEIQHDVRGGHLGRAGEPQPEGVAEIRGELYRYLLEMVRLFGGFYQVFIEF